MGRGRRRASAKGFALVDATEPRPYGALAPGWLDRAVIAATSRLPANWLGLRLAILLRRLVTMRLAAGGALDVERWGLRLRLHPLDNGCEKGLLFTPQMFEPEERAELARAIARKPTAEPFVFVDVGGNVGLFSLFVAAQSKGQARIVAFEPEPGNFARLAFNVAANPGLPIRSTQLALSDQPGELAIELDRRDRGGTRAHRLDADGATAGTVRVPCQTLLAALHEERIDRIDALKIDVEGMEDVVLMPFFRDAPPSLWPRLIVIEDAHELWSADLFGELARKGYAVASRSKLNVMLRRSCSARHDRHRVGNREAAGGHFAAIGQRLDAASPGPIERRGVAGIDVAGECEALRRADLDQIEHHGACARRHHVGELVEMLGAALGHGIGKFGQIALPHQVHVLDLDIAGRPGRVFEQEVDP